MKVSDDRYTDKVVDDFIQDGRRAAILDYPFWPITSKAIFVEPIMYEDKLYSGGCTYLVLLQCSIFKIIYVK